ncbi:TetR/AcrR family transcriptional regulator [Actinoplanes couchii]|nr:TetR-like C-terminal domain-containing protein [Actinoplanes couchii]MDR6321171.1 AcrR family transcriptional regulator [Actinoplanes couchii]
MVRAGLTTERVVQAGAELADDLGFAELTASTLARRLGVKVPSLYSHVGGTQDLRTRVALLALAELADRAALAVAGRSGKEALVALAESYRGYAREHPGRYAATRMRLDTATAMASAGPRHSQLTRAILRGYHLAEAEQNHAVRLIGSVIHGYIELESAGGFDHSLPDATESWNRALDVVDIALRNWP